MGDRASRPRCRSRGWSTCRNLGANNDHDSIGLFQQRPSQGWGTLQQLADPAYQSRKFFEKLLTIADWQTLPLTVAAQRVQISAYPNAYAKHEPLAAKVVDALTGGASRAVGTEFALRCAAGAEHRGVGLDGAGRWVRSFLGSGPPTGPPTTASTSRSARAHRFGRQRPAW